jgi:hypothetical protein
MRVYIKSIAYASIIYQGSSWAVHVGVGLEEGTAELFLHQEDGLARLFETKAGLLE